MKSFKEFNRSLGWSGRIYFLLAVLLLFFALTTDAFSNNWVLPMLLALLIVLAVELFAWWRRKQAKS